MIDRLRTALFATLLAMVGCYVDHASAALTIQQMMDRIRPQNVQSATVITHGYQFHDTGGDSLMSLATAIRNRIATDTNQPVWLVDYDIGDDGEIGIFDDSAGFLPGANDSGLQGHVVFLYDWAPESNRKSQWWAESAGDALFAMMTGMRIVDPRRQSATDVHMIAHSFGSGVNSEAVERMATYKIPVSQVTYIDPHDFDQAGVPVDEYQRIFDLGKPTGYGATVWNNVGFADTYYQTRGLTDGIGDEFTVDPEGRPIPGAYNRHLDGAPVGGELPAANPNPYDDQIGPEEFESDHGYAWEKFYRATVDGALPAGADPAAGTVNYNQTGWAYSINNPLRIARPQPNFYANDQDHEHSSATLQTAGAPNQAGLASLGITQQQVIDGRWAPDWTIDQIANGNFAAGSHDFVSPSIDIMAGWTHHGGAGGFAGQEPWQGGTNYYTRMYTGTLSWDYDRRHNYLYVPLNATTLKFDSRIWDGSVDDSFRVWMGNTLLGIINISTTDQNWRAQSFAIPPELRNTVTDIWFQLTEGNGGGTFGDTAEIDIDTVRFGVLTPQFQSNYAPGSVVDLGVIPSSASISLATPLTLANVGEAGSILDLLGLTYSIPFPASAGRFDVSFNASQIPVELVGGAAPLAQMISFQSFGAIGLFQSDITYSTTVGPQMYRLQVTVADGLPGDFNADGKVDAADYVVWRKNIGTPAAFNMWRVNFGATASGAGSFNTLASTPEPSSADLLSLAAGLVFVVRRKAN
jgi:hypothetical protein